MAAVSMTTREYPLRDYMTEVCEGNDVRRGKSLPFGAHEVAGGINSSIFTRYASAVRLELFGSPADAISIRAIDRNPARNRTGDVWHI